MTDSGFKASLDPAGLPDRNGPEPRPMTASAILVDEGRRVRVTWPDGTSRDIPTRWLFDHADEARDPVSGQRAQGAMAAGACGLEVVEIEAGQLRARFQGGQRRIALRRLREGAAPRRPAAPWLTPAPIEAVAPVAFDDYLADDGALGEVLSRVARWGLAVLVGAGAEPGAVERAVNRFGYIRETNYGRLFDVRIAPRPGNLAYTDQALDLHTDNPYRDPVPTLQLLHAITADGAGGATLFVDGFAHAEALRGETPGAFETLARTPVRFRFAAADGARWSCETPVLRLDAAGALEAVRLNHRSLDLALGDADAVEAWYDAYLAYYARVHAPDAAYARRLAPGEMVIFDNRRLLHGRQAMSRGSPRWLQGCYADVDGLAASLARLDAASAPAPEVG